MLRILYVLTMLSAGVIHFVTAQTGQVPEGSHDISTDSLALVDLYDSTDGTNWTNATNWKTTNPLSTWYGVTVDSGRVKQLWLCENNLSGHIPSSIGNLTALTHLSLRPNELIGNISGSIPSSIGALTRLVYLALSNNHLSGPIPSSIGNLINLELLTLDGNNLQGPIPDVIGNFRKLMHFNLSGNDLSGALPDSFATMDSLADLLLSGNDFTGPIPSSLYQVTTLRSLSLSGNQFTGSIPSAIGDLINLQTLNLSGNQLTGAIPASIGNLSQLTDLYLNNNLLTGPIPAGIWTLTQLQQLWLGDNQLTDTISSEIENLSQLNFLYLYNNQLSGYIPHSIGTLTNLSHINLGVNQFSGSIPLSIGKLTDLDALYLNDNQLTGSIPDTMANLRKLTTLFLNNNQLTGNIPGRFATRDTLLYLNLGGNQLMGCLPAAFGSMVNLKDLYLNNNQLTDIPDLSSVDSLHRLHTDYNQLTFEDIEPNISIPNFIYSPQDSVGEAFDFRVLPGDTLILNISVGGQYNQYQWYHNGNIIPSATDSTYFKMNASPADTGYYHCRITNTLATELTLFSRPVHVNVAYTPFDLDSLSLVDLYDSTDGTNWTNSTNWKTANPLSTWYGVTVDSGRVKQLWLCENNLSGHIPSSIGNLTALTHLSLRPNNLNGNLSGTIPTSIGNLTGLLTLQLSHNQLTGPIPSTIGNLVNLAVLTLDNNHLNGLLPGSTGNLRKLTHFNLTGNDLSGSLPDSFSTMDSLADLSLSGNDFSGFIPSSIGNLIRLKTLHLESNRLSGTIPISIGNLSQLEELFLNNNLLTGPIPAGIWNLTQLRQLWLGDNQLTDTIASSLGNLTLLNVLYLYNNQISGKIPQEIENLTGLKQLSLGDNQLSGEIPSGIGNLDQLENLNLNNNLLTGSIPSSFQGLSNLKYFNMSYNDFDELPDLNLLDSLKELWIHKNRFTFEDIEPNLGAASELFVYSPQDSVGSAKDTVVHSGEPFQLMTLVGGTANHYQWVRNGIDISGATASVFSVSSCDLSHAGGYQCRITSDVVPDLMLHTHTVTIRVITPPAAPQNLAVTDSGKGYVALRWRKNQEPDFLRYRIYADTLSNPVKQVDSTAGNDTTAVIRGLTNDKKHYFRVKAVDTDLEPGFFSNTASATPVDRIPPAVSGLKVILIDNGSVTLAWQPSADADMMMYRIYGGTAAHPVNVISTAAGGRLDTLKTVTGLTNGTTYYFRVTAVDSALQESGYSNEITAVPNLPVSITGVFVSPSAISEGGTVSFTVQVNSGSNPAVSVTFGKGSQSAGTTMPLTGDNNIFTYQITNTSLVTHEGLWYRVKAENSARTVYYPSETGKNNISIQINSSSIPSIRSAGVYPNGLSSGKWNTYSVPYGFAGALQLSGVLGEQRRLSGSGKPVNWAAYTYNPSDSAFHEIFSMYPSSAYLILQKVSDHKTMDDNLASMVSGDLTAFSNIILKPGWNLVPWPYTFSAGFTKDNSKIGALWLMRNSNWERQSMLKPYGGYMIYNKTFADMPIGQCITVLPSVTSAKVNADQNIMKESEWQIRFFAECGELQDHDNFIGVRMNSTLRFDENDEPEPVNPGNNIGLAFTLPDSVFRKSLCDDYRSAECDTHIWDMKVTNDVHQPLLLHWDALPLPADREGLLIDLDNNRFIDLKAEQRYSIRSRNITRFKIIAGRPSFVLDEEKKWRTTLPEAFALRQNYPNPFNPSTVISYQLAVTSKVSLKIYNMLGQEVRALVNGDETAGIKHVTWDGKDNRGCVVASGVYLCRIQAADFVQSRKMLLLK